MRRKMPMPMPVTVGDCLLLHQMGYRVVVHDGKVTAVAKENKKKNGISRNKTNSIVSLMQ